MKTLGDVIQKSRKEKKLTTTDLASKLNLTQGYISHIENNRKNPSLDIIRKLANALNIDFYELAYLAGHFTDTEIEDARYQKSFFDTMTPEELDEYIENQNEGFLIEEYRKKEFPDIEELLKQNVYFHKYKLSIEERRIVHKILMALFEDKENNYPTEEEIKEAYLYERKAFKNLMDWKDSDGNDVDYNDDFDEEYKKE